MIGPGVRLHLSSDGIEQGEPVTIWSPAPGPGCYWAHVGSSPDPADVRRIRVTETRKAPHPIVKFAEETE